MCEGDGSAGVGFEGGVVAVSAYMGGTRGSSVLASAGNVLGMSVVRGVGGVYDMCMCLARDGVGGVGVSGRQDWVWALPILEEHGEMGYVSVFWLLWCWGRVGGRLGPGAGAGRVGWCYVSVCCESGFSV